MDLCVRAALKGACRVLLLTASVRQQHLCEQQPSPSLGMPVFTLTVENLLLQAAASAQASAGATPVAVQKKATPVVISKKSESCWALEGLERSCHICSTAVTSWPAVLVNCWNRPFIAMVVVGIWPLGC